MSHSSNSVHSEYEEISKQLHELLMSAILISEAQKGYSDKLCDFKFSLDWGQLQSLIHHLESYEL